MRTCKDCKHWKKGEDYDEGDKVARPYHPVTFDPQTEEKTVETYGYAVRYCEHPKILFYERPEIDGAAVVDGSDYFAALLTAESFGCILHEEATA